MEEEKAEEVINLAELLDGVKELGGEVSITFVDTFPSRQAHIIVAIPGLKLTYDIHGQTEQECIVQFAEKFKPTFEYFANQHMEYCARQITDAINSINGPRVVTEKSATAAAETHDNNPE
jgi:hypothetical protein